MLQLATGFTTSMLQLELHQVSFNSATGLASAMVEKPARLHVKHVKHVTHVKQRAAR